MHALPPIGNHHSAGESEHAMYGTFQKPAVLCVLMSFCISSISLAPAPVFAQSNARTGCMNQWLFNGVWRVRVSKVEPIMNGSQQTGWQVTQTWRNGTSVELAPGDSLLKPETLSVAGLALESEGHTQNGLAANEFAPSGEFTYTQTFFGPNGSVNPGEKPKALDITFEGDKLATMNKPHFTSKQYNFHFDLSCTASGAAAQAQGGSTQIAAGQGCMNQWMSNGVWKMRVLAVTPNPPGATAANQLGWRIKQEWVNVTHVKVYPGVLPDVGNRVAPTNVGDEYLATKAGNNASSFNMVGGFALGSRNIPFPPGVPYTFEQVISWGGFNPADTPIRLLVTFNTAAQNKVQLPISVPRYHNPANFRINLTCGGSVESAQGQNTQESSPPPAAPANQVATAPKPSGGSGAKMDPCAMLAAPDVASALGVGVQSLGAPQHPSAGECAWAVASHAGGAARTVFLTVEPVAQKAACHGLGCLSVVQSVLNVPGVPGVPAQFAEAFNDAQMIAGLGDKAAWKDGKLTVVKADMAFQLFVRGSASPALSTSESLARTILERTSH